MIRQWTIKACGALITLVSVTMTTAYGEQLLPVWQVDGDQNQVFLLGSIHLLREKDHPLPEAIYSVYEEAETLIMELDMDDIDPVATQVMTTELGLIENGGTLAELLGPETYAKVATLAEAAEIPLKLLDRAEPWYAAMNVEMMLLMRMGFNPALGIESHMMERALSDNKEIRGLETMRQQLEFLDNLSPDAQLEMFLQALADGPEMQGMMDSMIDAWRIGDTTFIEELVLSDMQDYPELNEAIVHNRNVNWTGQIEDLLDDTDDYLVIVGTLHLVGEEGVPALLSARGHVVTQLHQASSN